MNENQILILIQDYLNKNISLKTLVNYLTSSTQDYILQTSTNIVRQALTSIGFGYNFLTPQILNEFYSNPIWEDILHNYQTSLTSKIKDAFQNSITHIEGNKYQISPNQTLKLLNDITNLTYNEAERVMRSNLHALYNISLKNGYEYAEKEKGFKFKYKWVGADDNRTSDICREIKRRVGDGVDSLEELEDIIEDVSNKYLGKYGWKYRRGSWLSHPNCRHRILAIPVD